MSRKVFTAGEVLAAADVNSFLMDQTVMSFAGTAARGSAIPSPVNGMTTYLEDTKDLQIYDGSVYNSASALTLVKKQVIGTGVSTVVVADVFSEQYDGYRITIGGGVGNNNLNIGLRLGSTSTGYYAGMAATNYATGAFSGASDNNGAQFSFCGYGTTGTILLSVTLHNPFLTTRTGMSSDRMVPLTGAEAGAYVGFLNDANSYTSFTLLTGAATLTGGTIYVYGYRKN
jgi:hypothetical protein